LNAILKKYPHSSLKPAAKASCVPGQTGYSYHRHNLSFPNFQ